MPLSIYTLTHWLLCEFPNTGIFSAEGDDIQPWTPDFKSNKNLKFYGILWRFREKHRADCPKLKPITWLVLSFVPVNLLYIKPPRNTRSSTCLTLSRPPGTSRVKATNRSLGHAARVIWIEPTCFSPSAFSCFTDSARPFSYTNSSCLRHYILFQIYILPLSPSLPSLALPISRQIDPSDYFFPVLFIFIFSLFTSAADRAETCYPLLSAP